MADETGAKGGRKAARPTPEQEARARAEAEARAAEQATGEQAAESPSGQDSGEAEERVSVDNGPPLAQVAEERAAADGYGQED